MEMLKKRNEKEEKMQIEKNENPDLKITFKEQKKGYDPKLYSELRLKYQFLNELYMIKV